MKSRTIAAVEVKAFLKDHPLLGNREFVWGFVKSRIIAAVAVKFFFHTIRSWIIVNSLGVCEVEDYCCCSGQVFLLIPSALG